MLKSHRIILSLQSFPLLLLLAACQPSSSPVASTKAVSQSTPASASSAQADQDLSRLQALFQQLQQLGQFDQEKIESLLIQHNKKQPQVASDQQDNPDWVLYDKGAWVLSLEQVGETSYTLLLRKVEEAHSAGVDEGEDALQTLIFNRQTMRLMRAVQGKLENWQTDGLQVVAGQKESCLGVSIPDSFEVIDLQQGAKTVLTQALQQNAAETSLYTVEVKSPKQLAFITTSDQAYTGKPEHIQRCDVGDWMDKLETTYLVNCDTGSACKVTKTIKRYAGCQAIGACD